MHVALFWQIYLYEKLPILMIFGALKSHNGEISRDCADLRLPTSRQIL